MFGIDPLTLSALMILAGGKTLECPDRAPTKINVIPQTKEVKYDYSQTLKEIQTYSMDTVDPYAYHGTSITQGFTQSAVGLEHEIKFGQGTIKRYKASCVWYETITVRIKIDPTVVIASELYKDPCMRKAVLAHELKHVRVDREVVNKYAKSMGKKLYDELKSRGFSAGPFQIGREREVADKMQRVVRQILELESQKMNIERSERQRAVDNIEEYESVDDKCPAFEKKKEALYAGLTRKKKR